jgi:cytochrome c oxidase assembly protein subunit 17
MHLFVLFYYVQVMGNTQSPPVESKEVANATVKQPTCKACCACPETKRARDQCIMERGEENCKELIEAHKKCMREQGFNI